MSVSSNFAVGYKTYTIYEMQSQQIGDCVFAILSIHPFSALSESVNVPSNVFPSSALVIPLTWNDWTNDKKESRANLRFFLYNVCF